MYIICIELMKNFQISKHLVSLRLNFKHITTKWNLPVLY